MHLSSGTSTSTSWSAWWFKILTQWRVAAPADCPSPLPKPATPPLCTSRPPWMAPEAQMHAAHKPRAACTPVSRQDVTMCQANTASTHHTRRTQANSSMHASVKVRCDCLSGREGKETHHKAGARVELLLHPEVHVAIRLICLLPCACCHAVYALLPPQLEVIH